MSHRFELVIALTSDLRHVPYVMEGFLALEKAGKAKLRLRSKGLRWRDRVIVQDGEVRRVGRPYPWSLNVDLLDRQTGTRGRFAVDLQDWREMFSLESLETCQVIFKRMFVEEPAAIAHRRFGVEVVPAGMNHSSDPGEWSQGWSYRKALALGRLESVINRPRRLVSGLRSYWFSRNARLTATATGSVSNSVDSSPSEMPDLPSEFAFFQVMFHGWGQGSEAHRLNRDRAEVIRALRHRLGERFLGGLVFSREPPAELADCGSTLPSKREQYLEIVERSAVSISTRGFGESPPWKLCEYLEAGKCIVAERMPAVLPTPLVDGQELIFFRDPEQCALAAERLLDDPGLRAQMSKRARDFYLRSVAPEAAAWRYLTSASESFAAREARACASTSQSRANPLPEASR